MSIRIGNETLKLVESKTILQQYGDVETGRIEITTYNPSMILNNHPANLFTNRNVFFLFHPFVIEHIAKPQYRFKNFIFQVCAEPKTTGRVKNLTIELTTRWDGHGRTLPLVSTRIVWQIHTMEEITFMEPNRDIKLVIIAQEEQPEKRTKTRCLKAMSAPFACPTHRTFYFVTADIYLFAADASKLSDKLKLSA